MLNYLENLAPYVQVIVVSISDDLINLYSKRGYKKTNKRVPLSVYLPENEITRPDVEFIFMEKQNIEDFNIVRAKSCDAVRIMELVNEAFLISIGNTGYAFRKSKRFKNEVKVTEDIEKYFVMKSEKTETIIAVAKVTTVGAKMINIGQLAVDTRFQVSYILSWRKRDAQDSLSEPYI